MEVIECDICCTQVKKIYSLECPNCHLTFCVTCQRQYANNDCMKCHMKFKQKFLIDHLGKKFIDMIIKPKIIGELMKEQKETLRFVQPLVDWEKDIREQKKKLRFGIKMTLPDRPKISKINLNMVFPCPIKECRGFVENGVCGLCHIGVCLRCREQLQEGHVCKIENIQSITMLMTDSKPCPKCCATIHRTEGCNHMFCTNCRTHFDWNTLQVLQNSTNGHYLHLQRFADNIPTRDQAKPVSQCGEREFSLTHDSVSIDTIDKGKVDKNLLQCLWDDSNTIRLVKRKKYNGPVIESEMNDMFQELQVKYLLQDINESIWSRYVYQYHNKKLLSMLYSDILDIYLAAIDNFQQMLSNNTELDQNIIINQYAQLVDLCNESFHSVQDEYGGNLHHIRHPSEDPHAPSFI